LADWLLTEYYVNGNLSRIEKRDKEFNYDYLMLRRQFFTFMLALDRITSKKVKVKVVIL